MSRQVRFGTFLVAGLVVSLALAMGVSQWASGDPDGLERVAIDQGFEASARDHPLEASPTADYGFRPVDDDRVATAVAGLFGVALTGAVMAVLVVGLRKITSPADPAAPGAP